MRETIFTLILGLVAISTGDEGVQPLTTKTWLGDMNFLNGINWNLKRRPCWKDRAILPVSLELAVRLPDGDTALRQLVLPRDGEVLLPKRGALTVSDTENLQTIAGKSCPGEDIHFLRSKIPLWADPDNWDGHNTATPDLEAIPCATDKVLFPDNSFSILMPDTPPRVAALNVFGMDYEGRTFSDLVTSDVGRAAFLRASRGSLPEVHITGRGCGDATGCECNNEPLRSAVCDAVYTRCTATRHCLQPVLPHGNCCPICGGFVLLKFTPSFKLEKFREYLSEKFGNRDVNFFASKTNGLIQVVFLERGEYEGKIDDYTKELKEAASDLKNLGLEFIQEFAAGPYVSEASFTSVAGLLIGLLFLALAAFAIIFCVHTEECKVPSNGQRRQYLFAVFENQGEEVELCKPEAETPAVPPRSRRQAFDNPMYGAAAQETLTTDADSVEKEDDVGDSDEGESDTNGDFPSSMEENNHIYAAMETIDLLGKIDGTHEEENVNANDT
ncbi:hypothetical protein LSTR_LSTR005050 [Laodelphax striatellus]|uniref:Protein amnionless n=1 Tax=Laodelphax striatellus TaxID=195883 RepID=A0A482WT34_LAOST|nr:hypothetical protein LSTR_LSTR005050 [Laodelphax striatellus]